MKKILILIMLCVLTVGCSPLRETFKEESNEKNVQVLNDKTKLSKEKVENLFILGKIWGYLKYYHPNVANGKFDWDQELIEIVPKVIQTKNSKVRDKVLSNWIAKLGDYKVETGTQETKNEIKLRPNLNWISNLNLTEDLVTKLNNIKNAKRENENNYVTLEKGVGNPNFSNETSYSMGYPDGNYRLLSLFRYWNIIEYFYPYKNLINENWDDVLKEFIPKFIGDSNEQEYNLTTLELIGRIRDTHANIWTKDVELDKFWGMKSAPLILSFVENKAVVTGYYDQELGKETNMKKGDIITKINNKPVEEIVKEKLKYIPASNYPTQLRDLSLRLLRTNHNDIQIEFIRNGKTQSAKIHAYLLDDIKVNDYDPFQINKAYFQQLDSNIAYIYPGTLKNEFIPKIIPKINKTKGLIIDLRCYPSDFIVYTLGEYLLPQKTKFAMITTGNVQKPGLFTSIDTALEDGKYNKDYYKGKVIILVNEFTQSQAEFTAMAFRTAPRATVIGSTTAGADGNVSFFVLPGGIKTAFSGVGVYYPDGSETQGVGIVPDIKVTPTIKGISENRDEVLEKAIELINKGN